jgi:hypothetical protein
LNPQGGVEERAFQKAHDERGVEEAL